MSYALSGNRAISRETRERIQAAIQELGFTPNAGARALATAQTKVIGVLLQFFEDEFQPAMMQYLIPIADAARNAGYDILMVTESDGPRALKRITNSNMVDGVVLLNVARDDPRLKPLRSSPKPGVLIGLPFDTEGVDIFDLDFGASAEMLVDHLHDCGHQELVLVTPHPHVTERGGYYSSRFRDATVARAERYGIKLHVHAGETRQPAVSQTWNRILDATSQATGIIVHNDAMVAALPSVLTARGVSVPEDVAVVGIFSEDFGREFSLPYSAIETSPEKLGRAAVAALVERMKHPHDGPPQRVEFIQPELTDRGSTRPL